MSVQFTKAVRENVGLWINLIGGTGSGKTFTAMRLASGIAGDKPFALIDTENRRGLHYADQFNFDHAELKAPFRPDAYAEAVLAADKAGYPVIVIDSGSHVWAGEGGMLDWHEQLMEGKQDSYKMAAWIKPKMAHKKMVQKLLQVKAHIILCLRAEEKVEMVKVNGKTEIRAKHSEREKVLTEALEMARDFVIDRMQYVTRNTPAAYLFQDQLASLHKALAAAQTGEGK